MTSSGIRLHLLVEGQTEAIVVRDLIRPYLQERGFWVSSSSLEGVSRWAGVHDGPLVIAELGVARLRECCPHVDDWLRRLGA